MRGKIRKENERILNSLRFSNNAMGGVISKIVLLIYLEQDYF